MLFILADTMPRWAAIVTMSLSFVLLIAFGWAILKGIRGFGAFASRVVLRRYEGLNLYNAPAPGLVEVVFHTYAGLLVFVYQQEHHLWASPADACELLKRLNRFNLTWGFFAYGAIVIPMLSLGNYAAQKRRIAKQAAA